MSGILAAIWYFVLKVICLMAIYIFMLLVPFLSGLTIVYSNSLLQVHLSTEPRITINSIFCFNL